jgi:predicted TIM-barrel fold metal-dependent hydrolase
MPRRRHLLAVITVLLALLTVAALLISGHLPGSAPGESLLERIFKALWKRRSLLYLMAAAFAVLAGLTLLAMRRFQLVKALAVLSTLALLVFGVIEFRITYPHQAVFDPQHIADAWAILVGRDIRLARFDPKPTLIVNNRHLEKAAFPVIDAHFHLGSLPPDITAERLVQGMDAAGIAKVVNLDGSPGAFAELAKKFRDKYPDRFIFFVKPNFTAAVDEKDGAAKQVVWMDIAAKLGARGVKVNKSLGMGVREANGKLVMLDDRRLDPIWAEAGRLGMPVLIHTGEPDAFFEPFNEHNERYEEILENPQFGDGDVKPDLPTKQQLMEQRERVLERHPETNFIGAHMGMKEDNLGYVSTLLDRFPNFYVDMASVVHALGRQPYTARKFFMKYQDRILFGTDGGFALQKSGNGWTPERYFRNYIEFLETENEYAEYPLFGVNKQGRWRVYGIGLPPDVLQKIYSQNLEKLLPSDQMIAQKLAGRFPSLETGVPIFPPAPSLKNLQR